MLDEIKYLNQDAKNILYLFLSIDLSIYLLSLQAYTQSYISTHKYTYIYILYVLGEGYI